MHNSKPANTQRGPDNFIGLVLRNEYTIGKNTLPSCVALARQSSRLGFRRDLERLSAYFHRPHVEQGPVEERCAERYSKRGFLKYVLISTMAIEITEEEDEA